jgi:glutamine synthetase
MQWLLEYNCCKQLKDFKKEVDALIESKDMKKDDAIFNVLREYIKHSKKFFWRRCYSEAWETEAKKEGLSNLKLLKL